MSDRLSLTNSLLSKKTHTHTGGFVAWTKVSQLYTVSPATSAQVNSRCWVTKQIRVTLPVCYWWEVAATSCSVQVWGFNYITAIFYLFFLQTWWRSIIENIKIISVDIGRLLVQFKDGHNSITTSTRFLPHSHAKWHVTCEPLDRKSVLQGNERLQC